MDLSIIIPYFNADKYIGQCLDSLIEQDIPLENYEIIVVDDGSTEAKDILESYLDTYPNIHYYYENNSRQGAARNNGIKNAKGDYVVFVDADDVVVCNRLSSLLNYVKNNQLEVLFYGVLARSDRDNLSTGIHNLTDSDSSLSAITSGLDYLVNPFLPWLFNPTQFVISRSFLLINSILFPEKWLIREDWAFIMDLLIPAKRVAATNSVFYYYIQTSGSIVHSVWDERYCRDSVNYSLYARNCIENTPSLSHHPAHEVVDAWIDECIFIMLGKMAKYSHPDLSSHYIRELEKLGFYPFKNRDGSMKIKLVKMLMNSRLTWLACCIISSKYRRFSYLFHRLSS